MMRTNLISDLKRIERQMKAEKNPDSLIIQEAICEIKDANARYRNASENLCKVLRGEQI